MPPRAVIFDATGTLIELVEPVGETYSRTAERHGASISAWRLDDAFQRVLTRTLPLDYSAASREPIEARERAWWRDLVRSTFLAADSAVRPNDFEACFATLWSHYASGRAWRARAGAQAALAALRAAGWRTAVVSNFDTRLRNILEALALTPLLDALVLPSDAGAAKPDPAILRHALARLGCEPAAAVVVGNDPARDLEPARRLGLAAIDVRELATLADLPARLASSSTSGAAKRDLRR